MTVSRRNSIESFVKGLGTEGHRPDLYNPYRGRGAPTRRHNLLTYFKWMQLAKPRFLLLGEAVGYRGGRMTGIPFVSEDIMLNGTAGANLFDAGQGYQRANDNGPLWREASATIVWQTIRDYQPLPILWNALPFHPHVCGNRLSNRTPRREELRLGMTYLPTLLELIPDVMIIAVGRRAEYALREFGVNFQAVRHPSHGGKTAFVAGLRRFMGAPRGKKE